MWRTAGSCGFWGKFEFWMRGQNLEEINRSRRFYKLLVVDKNSLLTMMYDIFICIIL